MANEAEPASRRTDRHGNRSDSATNGTASRQDTCSCFDQRRVSNRRRVSFRHERQDTSSPAWQHLLALIEEAAADGREVFRPLMEMSPEDRRQIVTLPPSIAKLTAVKQFTLYGSNLVRIPAEIGAMSSLQEFTPYTSYRLHWFPYEMTRCPNLKRSTVSTWAAKDPGQFTIGLLLGPGARDRTLDLSAPLGPQGVAVEIEGPDGLVGGAHGLPITRDDDTPSAAGGTVHVGPEGGASVQLTLPAGALCPGFDGFAVQQRLMSPTDSRNTIIGQPPYRLTVSISDPAIGALRRQVGSTVPGDVLATDNRMPH
ncbi:hypothetical protein [Kitasatospora sp. NPDC085464]|uniref:hypothetical protein n=1 Tax=Kitasatospora sp. NPDC085464 TaxID=3364063 RepID=UPI0037C6B3C9